LQVLIALPAGLLSQGHSLTFFVSSYALTCSINWPLVGILTLRLSLRAKQVAHLRWHGFSLAACSYS
jgi:hypothetical protein